MKKPIHVTPMPLNEQSIAVYDAIEQIHSLTGFGPTFTELMQKTGLKSKAAVGYHLERLEAAGYIKRMPNVDRGIVPIHYPRVYYRQREGANTDL